MTEKQWRRADPVSMLEFLGRSVSGRKMRLFACAGCRCVAPLLTREPSRVAVAVGERFADGTATKGEVLRASRAAAVVADALADNARERGAVGWRARSEHLAALLAMWTCAGSNREAADMVALLAKDAGAISRSGGSLGCRGAVLRDIVGNPFRPVIFSPKWRTDTAIVLARQMYESREFSALPILADALQDAGCDNEDLLTHCRGPGPHVRGCWVVDLILSKDR